MKSTEANRARTAAESEPAASADPRADQRRIRPTMPIRDLDEYVKFLAEVEAVFGPIRQPRRISRGGRFLL